VDRDRAQFQQGEPDREVLGAVVQVERDLLAFLDAELVVERASGPIDASVELPVGGGVDAAVVGS